MIFADLVNQHFNKLNDTDLFMSHYILEHQAEVKNMTTQEFAKVCMSSKSSVIRFSQKIGFTGFSELKNFIKWQGKEQELANNRTFKKQVYSDAKKTLDYMEQAHWNDMYKLITDCEMVYIISTGVTQQSQAAELQRLFLLIGKPTQIIPASDQSSEFRRIVERLRKKDLIFILSLSGENIYLQNLLKMLAIRESIIISVTIYQNNWLSGKADYNLYASSSRSPIPEDWWLQTASSFFLLIEAFIFGYVDYLRKEKAEMTK